MRSRGPIANVAIGFSKIRFDVESFGVSFYCFVQITLILKSIAHVVISLSKIRFDGESFFVSFYRFFYLA